MSRVADAWARFERSLARLDAALAFVDADAILEAAAEVHEAASRLATPGLVSDGARLSDALADALRRIESCRLKVMFLADHGARRVNRLTHGVSGPTPLGTNRAA